MSLAILHCRALNGLAAAAVTVEVHLANGLPAFSLVGLADTEVRESRERVRAALQVAGFEFPCRRITVNLAPADLPKYGFSNYLRLFPDYLRLKITASRKHVTHFTGLVFCRP